MDERPRSVNRPGKRLPALRAAPAELPVVAIVGRPNVGKSTLFNRLLRRRRALVHDSPGVTRDRVAVPATIEGRSVLLVDTGGLDPEADRGIAGAVAAQVQRVLSEAAVVLFIVDAREGVVPPDREIAQVLRSVPGAVVLVANKADTPALEQGAGEFHALGHPRVLAVSAERGLGIADLELEVAKLLPAAPVEASAPAAEEAVRIAVIGRPNVGKSSLVNCLAGGPHAIVDDAPGTTRDATDLRLRYGSRELVLVDTAGLRRPGRRTHRIERGSAAQARHALERAHAAVLLVDAVVGVTEQDAKIARLALDCGRPLLVALNKWDALDAGAREPELRREFERRLGFVPDRSSFCRVSAHTGLGVPELLRRVVRLARASEHHVATTEVNRALAEAVERNPPPGAARPRPRLFYATQVATRPVTLLVFVNEPRLFPESYRRYLESFLKKRLGLRAGPLRVLLRSRPRRGEPEIARDGRAPTRR